MTDTFATDATPGPKRFRNAMLIAGAAFVAGIGLTGWAVTQWKPAHDLVAPPVSAPVLAPVAPQPLTSPTPTAPVAATPAQGLTETRLAALEGRLAMLAQASNGPLGNSRRAEGLLLAFAARRALDRGLTLGYLEPELNAYYGATQPKAVAHILAASRAPATLAMLSTELDKIAPDLTAPPKDEGMFETIRRELAGLFVVRQQGDAPAKGPDRIALAQEFVKIGRVDQAMAEIARVDKVGKANIWLAMARRHVEANNALDLLEAAALTTPKVSAEPAPAPPATLAPSPLTPASDASSADAA